MNTEIRRALREAHQNGTPIRELLHAVVLAGRDYEIGGTAETELTKALMRVWESSNGPATAEPWGRGPVQYPKRSGD